LWQNARDRIDAGSNPINAIDPWGLVSVDDKFHNVGIIEYSNGKWVTTDWNGKGQTTVQGFYPPGDTIGDCKTTLGGRRCCNCGKYYLCTNPDEENYCEGASGGYIYPGWEGGSIQSLYKTTRRIGGGVAQAGQGLWNALGNENLQQGAFWGFSQAGKIALAAHTGTVVKTGAIYGGVTLSTYVGSSVYNSAVGMVLTHPQGARDVVTSMFPGTTPVPNVDGLIGWGLGELIGTGSW
jgi:hypothetical protein